MTVSPLKAADDAALRQLIDRYEAALRKSDVAVLTLYEADGDFVSYTGRHASGAAELREFYADALSRGGLEHSSSIDRVRWLSKSAAIVDGGFEIRRSSGAPNYVSVDRKKKGRHICSRLCGPGQLRGVPGMPGSNARLVPQNCQMQPTW